MPPRACLLILLAIVTPLGFGTKLYEGPGAVWIHDYAGGIFYEISWMLALQALLPQASTTLLAACVFAVTGTLEVLQLSRHAWLATIRSFYLGRILIGDGFDPWDFFHYGIGAALGWLLCRQAITRNQ